MKVEGNTYTVTAREFATGVKRVKDVWTNPDTPIGTRIVIQPDGMTFELEDDGRWTTDDGLIPLDRAIELYGEGEAIGGSGWGLVDFRDMHPSMTIYIEVCFDGDGRPCFETIWTDITDLGGPPYPVPQVPTGDENFILRDGDRLYLVSWYD